MRWSKQILRSLPLPVPMCFVTLTLRAASVAIEIDIASLWSMRATIDSGGRR